MQTDCSDKDFVAALLPNVTGSCAAMRRLFVPEVAANCPESYLAKAPPGALNPDRLL